MLLGVTILNEILAFSIWPERKTNRQKDEKWWPAVTIDFLLTAVFWFVEYSTNDLSLTCCYSPVAAFRTIATSNDNILCLIFSFFSPLLICIYCNFRTIRCTLKTFNFLKKQQCAFLSGALFIWFNSGCAYWPPSNFVWKCLSTTWVNFKPTLFPALRLP